MIHIACCKNVAIDANRIIQYIQYIVYRENRRRQESVERVNAVGKWESGKVGKWSG